MSSKIIPFWQAIWCLSDLWTVMPVMPAHSSFDLAYGNWNPGSLKNASISIPSIENITRKCILTETNILTPIWCLDDSATFCNSTV